MKKGPAPELGLIADKVDEANGRLIAIEFDNLMKFVRYHDRVRVVQKMQTRDFPYTLTLHGTAYLFADTDQIVPFVKSLGYQVLYGGKEI